MKYFKEQISILINFIFIVGLILAMIYQLILYNFFIFLILGINFIILNIIFFIQLNELKIKMEKEKK